MATKKLLIADDEPALRELVAITLQSEDYEILLAEDGVEALAIAQRERPEIALLDVIMPGLTGLEVCRQIKADPDLSGTTVIMLTASGTADDREQGRTAGAAAYLTKPFSPLQLLELVREVMKPEVPIQGGPAPPPIWQNAQSGTPAKALAIFMFIDIRGFTTFTATHGDAAAYHLVQEFSRIVRRQAAFYDGRGIKTSGDSILLSFPTAHQAVRAAVSIMESIAEYNDSGPEHPINVGMGLDVGEPVDVGGDYIGSALNRAARVTEVALKDQVLVTAMVRQLVADDPAITFYEQQPRVLRGFAGEQVLYEVYWAGAPAKTDQGASDPPIVRSVPMWLPAARLALAGGAAFIMAVGIFFLLVPQKEGLFPLFIPGLDVAPLSNAPRSVADIVAHSRAFTVLITATDAHGTSTGTGVVYDRRGLIVTSAHVLADAGEVKVFFADGTSIAAAIVGKSTDPDLAVLRIDAGAQDAAVFGDSNELRDGESIIALGYPGALNLGLQASPTQGIVSQTISGAGGRYIEISAALNPGVSGGPLLNSRGQVVGILVGRVESASGRNIEGIGFAIPINAVKQTVQKLTTAPEAAPR